MNILSKHYGKKRAKFEFKIHIKGISFESNEYFVPNSTFTIFPDNHKQTKVKSKANLFSAEDITNLPIDEVLVFTSTLYHRPEETQNYEEKERRIVVRQITHSHGEKYYKDIGHISLHLAHIVKDKHPKNYHFKLVDEHVRATINATLNVKLLEGESNTYNSIMQSPSKGTAVEEEASDDEGVIDTAALDPEWNIVNKKILMDSKEDEDDYKADELDPEWNIGKNKKTLLDTKEDEDDYKTDQLDPEWNIGANKKVLLDTKEDEEDYKTSEMDPTWDLNSETNRRIASFYIEQAKDPKKLAKEQEDEEGYNLETDRDPEWDNLDAAVAEQKSSGV